jgi:hypothetical protein
VTNNIGDPIKEDEVILECNKHGIDEKHIENFVRKYEKNLSLRRRNRDHNIKTDRNGT